LVVAAKRRSRRTATCLASLVNQTSCRLAVIHPEFSDRIHISSDRAWVE